MVGDGPAARAKSKRVLREAGVAMLAWFAGERTDVPEVHARPRLPSSLPSLAEGISNTILEAMATALPIVATDVGGNAELVEERRDRAAGPGRRCRCDGARRCSTISIANPAAARRARPRGARARSSSASASTAWSRDYADLYDAAAGSGLPTRGAPAASGLDLNGDADSCAASSASSILAGKRPIDARVRSRA